MVLVAVEVVPAGSKPPAAVSVRTSMGERHGFDATASLSTRASSLQQGRAEGSVESSPKLVRHIGSGSTWAEELSPLMTRSTAASSVRLRVLVSGFTSASVARRGWDLLSRYGHTYTHTYIRDYAVLLMGFVISLQSSV